MKPRIQRLRAEVSSDLAAFNARVEELERLPPLVHETAGSLAQAALAVHNAYGAVEAALSRVTRVLEGDLPEGPDWHQTLLNDMALEIESVRPAVLSPETLVGLRPLLAFRHFLRHSYAVALDGERLEDLRKVALQVRPLVQQDFTRLDNLLRGLAAAV